MSSSGPAPSWKNCSGLGCQPSAPPTSIAALTATGSPIVPSSISARAAWYAPPRKMSGAQPSRSPRRSASATSSTASAASRRERLLGVDVLARRERRARHLRVREGRSQVEHDLDRGSAISSSSVERLQAVVGGERLGERCVEVGAGDQLDRVERRRVLGVVLADHPAADDPDLHAATRTRASERSTASSAGTVRLVLLDEQPLDAGLDRRRDDRARSRSRPRRPDGTRDRRRSRSP